jgi:hypothetical protein
MCARVKCQQCGKASWAGCGMHVEQALVGVPKDARCRCHEAREEAPAATEGGKKRRLFGLF